MKAKVGFVGVGWIGSNYANDFEHRGYDVIRYSLEPEYVGNKALISACDIVFIAVPTPTTEKGFIDTYVRDALTNVGKGKIAVIKSTLLPGTTNALQDAFPDKFVLHSPEFLTEKTAAYDAAHPNRNIIGIPKDDAVYREKAAEVLRVLPDAPFTRVMAAKDAEFVKYAGNCFLFTKVVFANMLYDLVERSGGNWDDIRETFIHDPRIGESHTNPVDKSRDGERPGRGAGGHCFIKDFEAFRRMYAEYVGDTFGDAILKAEAEKNIELLVRSGKDLDLVEGVYGDITKYNQQ